MAQPFLETRQGRLLVTGLDIDHPVRRQPGRLQPRRKQILITHAPEDLPHGPCQDAGRKQSRGSAVQRTIAGPGHLMQGAEGQATAGQAHVHLRHAEGENPRQTAIGRLKPADFFAQKIDGG